MSDYQVTWDGNLITGGMADGSSILDGWEDLPGFDFGDAEKPAADGAWPGAVRAQSRHVTWRFRPRSSREAMGVDMKNLRAMITRTQDERELIVNTLGTQLMCFARVEQRIVSIDRLYAVGRPGITVQWVASDPRRYSVDQYAGSIQLPTPPIGIAWPFTWPVTWDATVSGSGQMNALNQGDTDSPPTITILGPVDTPSITNEATGDILEFGLVLDEGEALSIDVRAGTVTLGGSDRSAYVTARSVPVPDFLLAPGNNLLAFRSPSTGGGGNAAVSVVWRDAYL